jgi:HSP20 family protein
VANVTVQKIEDNRPAAAPVLEEMKATFDKIRKRAFELFEWRGGAPGFDLDDWVRAEKDLFWVPQAELIETEGEFKIKVGVPGFDAKDIDIKAHSNEILVMGHSEKREEKAEENVSYSEFGMKSLYRRFPLPTPIEISAVTANVEQGLLIVVAKKKQETKEAGKKIGVAA